MFKLAHKKKKKKTWRARAYHMNQALLEFKLNYIPIVYHMDRQASILLI